MITIFTILILILSVVIHEVSHGWVAYALGDPTAKLAGRLTLNPLPHLDPVGSVFLPLILFITGSSILFGWAKPVPYNPYNLRAGRWGPAIVGLAGPVSNLFLAGVFSIIIRLTMGAMPIAFFELTAMIIIINLSLAIFNLIPIPPLDGSKILFALIPYRYHVIEEVLTRYQLFFVLIVITLIAPLLLPILSFLFQLGTGLVI
ncbi:MAG: site-2 protease family protein [Candidatus Vogelbacteria bacterium]